LQSLENGIKGDTPPTEIDLFKNVKEVLSMKWLGSIEERNTPLYNLKRNYRYDVDRNSGKTGMI